MAFNAPYNQRNIDELIDRIKSNYVIPYIGADMSILFDNIFKTFGNKVKVYGIERTVKRNYYYSVLSIEMECCYEFAN